MSGRSSGGAWQRDVGSACHWRVNRVWVVWLHRVLVSEFGLERWSQDRNLPILLHFVPPYRLRLLRVP